MSDPAAGPSASVPDPSTSGSSASHGALNGARQEAPEGVRRSPRRFVALLLGVEALMILAVGAYALVLLGRGEVSSRFGIALAVLMGILVAALLLAARSLVTGGRFGVGYGITWQLFQCLIAVNLMMAHLYWQGAVALLLAIAVLVALVKVSREEHDVSLRVLDR